MVKIKQFYVIDFIKLIFITIVIIKSLLSNTFAQKIEQHGWVTELNSNKTPLNNVQIVYEESVPTTSDDAGNFVLSFINKNYGDLLIIEDIHRKGYELVNEKELQFPALSINNLEVILCKTGLLDKMRAEYYDISISAFNKGYEQKQQKLQKLIQEQSIKQNEYEMRIEELHAQYRKAQEKARELSDKYARTNFDDVSVVYKLAFDQFKQGNIEKTIEVFENIDLFSRIRERYRESQKIENRARELEQKKISNEKGIKQDMQAIKLAADMYILKFNTEKADEMYYTLWSLDTTIYENAINYANFLYEYKRFYDARLWYKKALQLSNTKEKEALTLNNLGLVYYDLQSYEQAEDAYDDAMEIIRILAKSYPEVYLPDVALILNNFGNLFSSLHSHNKAINCFSEALEIYRKSNVIYKPDLAMTLSNIGSFYSELQQYDKAIRYYSEALGIYKELNKQYPDEYLSFVALSLNNIGGLYVNTEKLDTAILYQTKALEINQKLAHNQPEIYLPVVATILTNLGITCSKLNYYDNAIKHYEKAIEIQKEFYEKYPERYAMDLAKTLNNFGALLLKNSESFDKAGSCFSEAMKIYNTNEHYSKNHQADIAQTLTNYGNLYRNIQDYTKAYSSYREALMIYRNLAEKNTDSYLPDLAKLLYNLGQLQTDLLIDKKAIESYLEALNIFRDLEVKYPENYSYYKALVLNKLGSSYLNIEQYNKSLEYLSEALLIFKQMNNKHPNNYLPDIATSLNNLGALYLFTGLYEKSSENIIKSIDIFEELVIKTKSDQEYVSELARAYLLMAELQKEQNLYEEAINYYHLASDKFEKAFVLSQYKRFNDYSSYCISEIYKLKTSIVKDEIKELLNR